MESILQDGADGHQANGQSVEQSELLRLQRLALTLYSARGGEIGRIIADSDFILEIYQPATILHPCRERYRTESELYQASINLNLRGETPLDIRGDLRQQTVAQLRAWADELLAAAVVVESRKSEPFHEHPKAYVSREIATQAVVSEAYTFDSAFEDGIDHFKRTRVPTETKSFRLSEFPESQARFERECNKIPALATAGK